MTAGRILAMIILTFAVGLFGLYVLSHLSGCSSTQAQRAETALDASFDIIGTAIDSASRAAREACVAKQDAETAKVRGGSSTAVQAEAEITKIRQRCNEVRETFSLIRSLYNQAVDFRKSDALEQAKAKLEEAKNIWREILGEQQAAGGAGS